MPHPEVGSALRLQQPNGVVMDHRPPPDPCTVHWVLWVYSMAELDAMPARAIANQLIRP